MSKLVIVTNSLTGGGAERAMNLLTHELVKNHEVTLVTINSGVPDLIKPMGTVIELNRKWQSGVSPTLKALWDFLRVIRNSQPEITILNCDLPEFFGCFLPSSTRIVVIEHVNYPFNSRKILGQLVRKILRVKGANFASVSNHLNIWPSNSLPEFILENPLDLAFVQHLEDPAKSPITELVFIGRLINPQKRPEIAIEVAARSKLPIRIIGDGPLRSDLELLAISKGVSAKFMGHIRNPWENIHKGCLLLLTSAFEGDGLVAVEALCLNVPLLLSANKDFQRFNLPSLNYCDSVEEFIEKIGNYKSDISSFQIDASIRASLTASRSLNNVSKQWTNMIQVLLDEKATRI